MKLLKEHDEVGELPHGHLIQVSCLVFFLVVWFLDSFVFGFSTFFAVYLSWIVHLVLALGAFAVAMAVLESAHGHLHSMKSDKLMTTGIYGHIRHPLYLGTLMLYLPFILWSFSLLSIIPWLIAIAAYNKMANYEEQLLTKRFGKEYAEYKKRVRKWV